MTGRGRFAWLNAAAAVAVLGALVFAMLSPRVESQGDSARMLFVHVPTIWLAYLAFTVTFIASTFPRIMLPPDRAHREPVRRGAH